MLNKKDLFFCNIPNDRVSKEEINIVLLAHVKRPRGMINKDQIQCSETEHFSIDEFNDIYQGIVNADYYIQAVYFNELDFLSEYIEHPDRFKNCLIYNLARNGVGNNKKTLIPSFCELVGLKYTSSSSLSCSLCRDKYYFTSLLQSHNIPVPKSWLYQQNQNWLNGRPNVGTQIIYKPCSESASQGVSEKNIYTIKNDNFEKIISPNTIIQEYISGEECEVPVFKFGNKIQALSPVGINLKGKRIIDENCSNEYNYDFYDLKTTQPVETINKIMRFAEETFKILQMDVYGRVDFRINETGEPFVFDVSTTPYTINHSSFAFAFKQLGKDYIEIYDTIISAALMRDNY